MGIVRFQCKFQCNVREIFRINGHEMKIDDIQIEAVAKNHLWANIARDGDALVLTDFRHPGTLRVEWDGDILWISHSSGEQVGISADPPLAPILDLYLPGMFTYFAVGGEKPTFPDGVLVEGEELPADGTTEREQVIAARKGQGIYRERGASRRRQRAAAHSQPRQAL